MRISYNWLRQWVPTDLSADEAAERFTAAGLEVDAVTELGKGLEQVVAGRIVETRPHPSADRLQVCTVDLGTGAPATVVCGAPNARVGLVAPLATPGARLPNGMEIGKATLRGVESEGMLCSEPELGLGDDAGGLMELPGDLAPGTALAELLGLPDWIIELDLTPNRADCLSVIGLARELSALCETPVSAPPIPAVEPESLQRFPIELLSPEDCSRYAGRVIEGIDPTAATPDWMIARLRAAGIKPHSPTVDVTNYVLLELGQPMHAFDLDRLQGGIRVRRAAEGESITLLDDTEARLEPDMLVIADHAGPVALAGIMGGLDSAVTENTARILLESAWFNPAIVVGRGRRFGLATESAHRFERGVDPALQALAIERATALITEIAGGTPGPLVDVTDPSHRPVNPVVSLRLDRVNRVLGASLTGTEVKAMLSRLEMQVRGSNKEFQVRPPSARRDIAIEVDLIEEVARMVGYDNLPVRTPGGRIEGRVPSERETLSGDLLKCLQGRGFQEIMTWSFVSMERLQALGLEHGAQPLANPLSQDMAILRTSLLPGLLETAAGNLRRQHRRLRLAEVGHVFHQGSGSQAGAESGGGFEEREMIGLLITGPAAPEGWANVGRSSDFYDLKGEVERLLADAGHLDGIEFRPTERAWLHPGQAADALLNGVPAGWLGQLHPATAASLDLRQPVFVAELGLEVIGRRGLPAHAGVARYPSVRRDLALVVPETVPAAELVTTMRASAGDRLENLVIFDRYQGEGIEPGYKSVAIGLIFRDVSRTLTDQEVERTVDRVTAELERVHQARIRG